MRLSGSTRTGLMFAVLAMAWPASHAAGAILATESFDYPSTTSIDGQGGATDGWGGAWSLTVNGANHHAFDASSSLTFPGVTSAGGRIVTMSDESAERALANPTNAGVDGEIWISMLIRKDDTGRTGFAFANANGDQRFQFGFVHDERVYARLLGGEPTAENMSEATIPIGETVLAVIKLTTISGSGNDSVAVKLFKQGDPIVEPTTFDITSSGATGITMFKFVILGTSSNTEIDEIRIGQSFEDIAPIPEPASLGLMGVGTTLLLARGERGGSAQAGGR